MRVECALTALALTAVSLSGCGGDSTSPPPSGPGVCETLTIVECAQLPANDALSQLVTDLTTAGLVDTLSGDGPFTVFAPTNDAFTAGPQGLSVANLTDVLKYHVVGVKAFSSDLTDGEVLATVFTGHNSTAHTTDGVTITSETDNVAKVTTANVNCSNGVVHIVDAVLVPMLSAAVTTPAPSTPAPSPTPPVAGPCEALTIADCAQLPANSDLTSLVAALTTADLVATLQGEGPYTVFAPTNAAFTAGPQDLSTANLTDVLTYHVHSGTVLAAALTNDMVITTVYADHDLTAVVATDEVSIKSETENVAKVTAADVICSNGVVHIVDAVLVPILPDGDDTELTLSV